MAGLFNALPILHIGDSLHASSYNKHNGRIGIAVNYELGSWFAVKFMLLLAAANKDLLLYKINHSLLQSNQGFISASKERCITC